MQFPLMLSMTRQLAHLCCCSNIWNFSFIVLTKKLTPSKRKPRHRGTSPILYMFLSKICNASLYKNICWEWLSAHKWQTTPGWSSHWLIPSLRAIAEKINLEAKEGNGTTSEKHTHVLPCNSIWWVVLDIHAINTNRLAELPVVVIVKRMITWRKLY